MRTVSVRLRTLCGCIRFMTVPGPAPQTIEVPITVGPDGHQVSLKSRTFALLHWHPMGVAVEADYVELPTPSMVPTPQC